jgi:hypothetical protein
MAQIHHLVLRTSFAAFVWSAAASGCSVVTSFDGFSSSGSAVSTPGFAYRRTITLTSDAPAALSKRAVHVVLPKTFDYTHVLPNGADLRFHAANVAEELPYYVENWERGGESWVWVLVPVVPVGTSEVTLVYGNPSAPPQTSFEATFPRAQRTLGGGSGSFAATGDIDVDWFELRAGDTLSLSPGVPLKITAERIIIAGTIDGNGRGHPGGASTFQNGSGPGAGRIATTGDATGGGGYGGAGGRGGSDTVGAGGAGGPANGTATGSDIALGSGGASAAVSPGGAGGGAVSLFGWKATVTGAIKMNGGNGAGLAAQNSGGGSGGGILAAACFLELGGAVLEANGGAGGPCSTASNDGGGGGGGGRIKLRRRAKGAYVAPTSMTAKLGPGGGGAATTAPGQNGSDGTTDVNESSNELTGVETSLGPETEIH